MVKVLCRLVLVTVTAVCLNVMFVACSKSVAEKRAAKPDFSERLKRDAVKGEVADIGKNSVAIRQDNGETTRIRVDDNTKMDRIVVGDHVKAYVTDDGYASTIQRMTP